MTEEDDQKKQQQPQDGKLDQQRAQVQKTQSADQPHGQSADRSASSSSSASSAPSESDGRGKSQRSAEADAVLAYKEPFRYYALDDGISLSQHIILYTVAAFVGFFVIWANFATLDEVTRGDGRVVPSQEVQIMQSLEGGIIEEFFVTEGQLVKKGQPLIRLQDVRASSDLGANRQKYLGLKAKATRLRAEANGSKTLEFEQDVLDGAPQSVAEEQEAFRANRTSLDSQLQVLEERRKQRMQEVREIQSRMRDLSDVIRLSKEEMAMIAPLVEKGSAPRVELIQLERALKQQESEYNSLQSSLPRVRGAVDEADARIAEMQDAAKAKAQNELSSVLVEMNTIGETLTALTDRQDRTEIRSRVNGAVKDIKVGTVGGVVQPGEDIIEIVPQDDQLLVEARIRPSDIAFLHPGQKAVVKITAYDFSIYGGLEGKVTDISADSITNEQGDTFYRVRVRTDKNYLERGGERLNIIPGMVASVDILTGEKTVMQYILKPLVKTLNNSLGER